MSDQRKKEWFENEAFWRDLYSYMFPEKRFPEAAMQIGKVLKLAKPKGKAVLGLRGCFSSERPGGRTQLRWPGRSRW